MKNYPTEPGDPEDTKSFLNASENEAMMAVYLGCETKAGFRSMLFSSAVLQAVSAERHLNSIIRAPRILQAAQDLLDEQLFSPDISPVDACLLRDDVSKEEKDSDECIRRAYILLTMLHHLEYQEGSLLADGAEKTQSETEYDDAFAELLQDKDRYGGMPKPTYSHVQSFKNNFGPHFHLKESPTERLNRGLQLIRHARYRYAASKRRAITSQTWERESGRDPTTVDLDLGPEWMKTKSTSTAVPQASLQSDTHMQV